MKKAALSWRQIHKLVSAMFSHDLDYEDMMSSTKKLHFYGNDAVCLFKYFVRSNDPQKFYVWAVTFTNLLAFGIIAVSYLKINLVATNSAQRAGQKSDRRIQQKIAAIILTDFVCWFPFITCCILHSIEIVDMTEWYSFFSIVILPVNSVINPMLYSDGVRWAWHKLLTVASTRRIINTTREVIEMREVPSITMQERKNHSE